MTFHTPSKLWEVTSHARTVLSAALVAFNLHISTVIADKNDYMSEIDTVSLEECQKKNGLRTLVEWSQEWNDFFDIVDNQYGWFESWWAEVHADEKWYRVQGKYVEGKLVGWFIVSEESPFTRFREENIWENRWDRFHRLHKNGAAYILYDTVDSENDSDYIQQKTSLLDEICIHAYMILENGKVENNLLKKWNWDVIYLSSGEPLRGIKNTERMYIKHDSDTAYNHTNYNVKNAEEEIEDFLLRLSSVDTDIDAEYRFDIDTLSSREQALYTQYQKQKILPEDIQEHFIDFMPRIYKLPAVLIEEAFELMEAWVLPRDAYIKISLLNNLSIYHEDSPQ